MPRVRGRRKAPLLTARSTRKRNVPKTVIPAEVNGIYDSDEEIPEPVPVPRQRKNNRRKPRGRRSDAKASSAKRKGRKRASLSSDDNSEVPDSDDDSSDEDGSSEDEIDEDAAEEEVDESEISEDVEDSDDTADQKKRTIIPRDRDPVYVQDRVFPPLQLPPSSEDLIVPNDLVLQALGVYEILRRFSNPLQLTPFRFEEFCCALMAKENSRLVSEIFSAIIRLFVRESETSRLWLAPHDEKDSVFLPTYCLDSMTWPELLRAYLSSSPNFTAGLSIVNQPSFPCVPAKAKLELLELLCTACLQLPGAIRSTLVAENVIQHEESCRACQKPGDLICCEYCPATYHLECSVPPLKEIPEGEWICSICRQNQVTGVTDCESDIQKQNFNLRQEPIGLDRHGRRFAFLTRRLFVYEEDESAVWYYSTIPQFEEVLRLLDTEDLEKELCEALAELRDEIASHMEITMKLTKKAASGRLTYIEQSNVLLIEAKKQREVAEKSKAEEMEVDGDEKTDDLKKEASDHDASDGDSQTKEDSQEAGGSGVATRTRTGALVQKSYTEVKPVVKEIVHSNHTIFVGDPSLVFDLTKYGGNTFKLGLDGSFRSYRNIFTENQLAQNKSQKAEDRDRRRHLSAKFYISADKTAPNPYEFRWHGAMTGLTKTAMATVKAGLVELEKSVYACYYHTAWAEHRSAWLASLEAADHPSKVAPLLITLEATIRPIAYSGAWHDTLGCIKWGQFAAPDREESRNQERRRRREEDELVTRSAKKCYVSFVLGVHHQIWKHKGEEFRLSGKGGVFWWSSRHIDEVDDTPARCVTPPPPDTDSPELFDISAALARGDDPAYPVDENVRSQLDKLWKGIEVRSEPMDKVPIESSKELIPTDASNGEKKPEEVDRSATAGETVKVVEKPPETVTAKVPAAVPVKVSKGKDVVKSGKNMSALLGLMSFKREEEMLDAYHMLPKDFRALAVNAGLHEMPGFKYDYKTSANWEYPHFPRPNMRTAWRFRTYSVVNWGGVALQLRLLHAVLRWEDMNTRPPVDGRKIQKDENATVHSVVMQKRPIVSFTNSFPRFEYLIKRVVNPIKEGNGRSNQKSTPGREGLRERRIEPSGSRDPYALESWIPEEELELWEIKSFYDRIEHPVEVPKPPTPVTISTPARITGPSLNIGTLQRGQSNHFLVEIPGRGSTSGKSPQYVILPSGYGQMGKMLTPIRVHDTRTGMTAARTSPVGEEAAADAMDAAMQAFSSADKSEKWIKEQAERINKRVTHLLKVLPTKTTTMKTVYARRQEDLHYVVFQALVNHNPELTDLLPDPPGPSSTAFTSPTQLDLPSKKRPRPKKERAASGSPAKSPPKIIQPSPTALTNGEPVTAEPVQSGVIPPLRIKKNLMMVEETKKSPEEVVSGKSRAKMISTAPKVVEVDRTPKRRGRKSNAMLQQEAEEAAAAERLDAVERAKLVEIARAEAAVAATAMAQQKIPSPLPERKSAPESVVAKTSGEKKKKRKRPKLAPSDQEKTVSPNAGLPAPLSQPESTMLVTPKRVSGEKKRSSGKSKKRKHIEMASEPAPTSQPSPKKHRNKPNAKLHAKSKEENGTDLHCYCRTPYDQDRFYIGCDKCEKWYHGECVNVKENDVNLSPNAKWFCPDCVATMNSTSKMGPIPGDVPHSSPPPPAPAKVKSNKKKRRVTEVSTPKADAVTIRLPKLKIKIPPPLAEPVPVMAPLPGPVKLPNKPSQPAVLDSVKPLPKLLLKLNKKPVQDIEDDQPDEVLDETVEEPKSAVVKSAPSKLSKPRTNSTSNSSTGQKAKPKKEKEKATKDGQEVYCLCEEPAAVSGSGYRKFIMCNKCSQWYHPRCVGLTAKKADVLSTYACPVCQKSPSYKEFLQRPLNGEHCKILQAVISDLSKNRAAGPFLHPVDPLQAPNYYLEIAEPMDFSAITSNLQTGTYKAVLDFTRHCGLVFDNARTYNQEGTVYYKGAEQLEEIFVNRMNKLRLNWKA